MLKLPFSLTAFALSMSVTLWAPQLAAADNSPVFAAAGAIAGKLITSSANIFGANVAGAMLIPDNSGQGGGGGGNCPPGGGGNGGDNGGNGGNPPPPPPPGGGGNGGNPPPPPPQQ